jgi:hypothetical protein
MPDGAPGFAAGLDLGHPPDLKYDYAKYDEIQVRIYGEIAIVTARVTVKSELKGASLNGQFRSTLTLFKVKGMWELVASQASAIN